MCFSPQTEKRRLEIYITENKDIHEIRSAFDEEMHREAMLRSNLIDSISEGECGYTMILFTFTMLRFALSYTCYVHILTNLLSCFCVK